jgi:ATP-dependent helicase Lhr and Lhr-like helicase
VNNRRLAERLTEAINTLAGEPLVRSHHGSLAPDTRREVEELLGAGRVRGLVTTSSLELGIDMEAVDLVVQVEAPPSVASALQRVGRAGHRAGASSHGIIVPKVRGDLLACAACTRAMHDGAVESLRYPRAPLDVLAQQIVASVAMDAWRDEALFAMVRGAAPFAALGRRVFDGVLDMLSGRHASDTSVDLRPRISWDRIRGIVTARDGARQVVVANAGTIPDRGLYGVFLAGAHRPTRLGELDEEMVFELHPGDTFALGASTWRVETITHDRVIVTPAPGEPGRMPFWHGERAGRPVEFGRAIGALVRDLRDMPRQAAEARLVRQHDLDVTAARALLGYLDEQGRAGAVPDDRTVVIERTRDELGDWRVCVLSPLGSRVHAPWAMAVVARLRESTGFEPDVIWGDEGFVLRLPGAERPPDSSLLVPDPRTVEAVVAQQIGGSSLFAARFREAAARALLLPRRRPGARTPLWRQRQRAADLLAATAGDGAFPIRLEAHREILGDQFDMPALVDLLTQLGNGSIRMVTLDNASPSPFAASLLFDYVAHYIYEGDAPLAERRAQALSVDQAQLRELMGDAELRELLDAGALAALERRLQHLDDGRQARTVDGLHDLLLRLGDLSAAELAARSTLEGTDAAIAALERDGRIVRLVIAGAERFVAVEHASRYRDALGLVLPDGIPAALLEPVGDPVGDLVRRVARTHGPFTPADLSVRYGLAEGLVAGTLERLVSSGRLVEGEFRPRGHGREWVDAGVLRTLRQWTLARLRREIEPAGPQAFARFLLTWHGIGAARAGLGALLDAIEQLQGAALPASVLEREILPARVGDYQPPMLDTLAAAGDVIWVGLERVGDRDGRVALLFPDRLHLLRPPAGEDEPGVLSSGSRAADVLAYLRAHGASFFTAIHAGTGGGYPAETVDALWTLVWTGHVTNDTLHPLRAWLDPTPEAMTTPAEPGHAHARRGVPPAAQGRWSALAWPRVTGEPETSREPAAAGTIRPGPTHHLVARVEQLLLRHGVVTREAASAEGIPGGFSTIYPVLRAMEEAGRVRRGYFVAGLGGLQFARPAALDLLRATRTDQRADAADLLAATDPANAWGLLLPWPALADDPGEPPDDPPRPRPRGSLVPARTAGASVVLVDGDAIAYLRKGERDLLLFGRESGTSGTRSLSLAARALLHQAGRREPGRRGMLISTINGRPALDHPAAAVFAAEGFASTALGLQVRTEHVRPRGYGWSEGSTAGTGIAAGRAGGAPVAERERDQPGTTQSSERGRDTGRETGGTTTTHEPSTTRSDHRTTPGGDIDPDSAFSDVNRDDMLDEDE